jgi:hypothetical protein
MLGVLSALCQMLGASDIFLLLNSCFVYELLCYVSVFKWHERSNQVD